MVLNLADSYILFGGFLAFLFAVSQFVREKRGVKNYMLFIIFSSIAIIQLQQYFLMAGGNGVVRVGDHPVMLAQFVLGPSLYIFYCTVFNKKFSFANKTLIHYIPALCAFLLVLAIVLSERSGFVSLFSEPQIKEQLVRLFHSFGIVSGLIYLSAIFFQLDLLSLPSRHSVGKTTMVAAAATAWLLAIMVALTATYLFHNPRYARATMFLISSFMLFWFIMGQKYPYIFHDLKKGSKREKKGRENESSVKNPEMLKLRITLLMEEERIYCDEDLSLSRLSTMLDVSPHQLSAFLNSYMHSNFNSYINEYRVKEAISQMKDNPQRSLLDIALSSGFNSKSVFYDVFTRSTGKSPARFRSNLQNEIIPEL